MRTKVGRATKNTGAGTVTDVTGTPTGHVTVATGTTTPKLAVVSAPTAGSTGKLHATPITGNPTAAGEVLISTAVDAAHWAAGGTGTVSDVTGTPTGHVTVATGTTTPKLAVVSSPTTGKLNTTVITGNPAAATEILVSTAADAIAWKAKATLGFATLIEGATSATGVVMTAAAQNILTLTVPNDGKVHAFLAISLANKVTAVLNGGSLVLHYTNIHGVAQTLTLGTSVVGTTNRKNYGGTVYVYPIKPGSQVKVTQTALVGGAGIAFAKIVIS